MSCNTKMYGEIQYFLTTNQRGMIKAVMKKINVIENSICSCTSVPSNASLLEMFNVYSYGSYFKKIEMSEELVDVSVGSFLSKCIILNDSVGNLFLTEIISTFEHN